MCPESNSLHCRPPGSSPHSELCHFPEIPSVAHPKRKPQNVGVPLNSSALSLCQGILFGAARRLTTPPHPLHRAFRAHGSWGSHLMGLEEGGVLQSLSELFQANHVLSLCERECFLVSTGALGPLPTAPREQGEPGQNGIRGAVRGKQEAGRGLAAPGWHRAERGWETT